MYFYLGMVYASKLSTWGRLRQEYSKLALTRPCLKVQKGWGSSSGERPCVQFPVLPKKIEQQKTCVCINKDSPQLASVLQVKAQF